MSSQTRLFVGNLPENTDETNLHDAFSVYGKITNLELKNKSAVDNDQKHFAFITLSASNFEVESCIKHFSNVNFKGNKLYVTRARESFLERLQRERAETQAQEFQKHEHNEHLQKRNPVIKLSDKLNPRKRKSDNVNYEHRAPKPSKGFERNNNHGNFDLQPADEEFENKKESKMSEEDKKKMNADKKRMESMKKKRQDFKEKQMIIKTGLIAVDKAPNKKVIFSDNEELPKLDNSLALATQNNLKIKEKKTTLFNDDESGDEINFEIKKQFEGKQGQQVLNLQSRYKSDKRFILDERFINDESDEMKKQNNDDNNEKIEVGQADEKVKQLNILQDVLGVAIKSHATQSINDNKKAKPKLGMLRFDPSQPEHAKFLAPIEEITHETSKKLKKKKSKEEVKTEQPEPVVPKVEVSKEQFYKVSETLKQSLTQPNQPFSLRSLFAKSEDAEDKVYEQETGYKSLDAPKDRKVKNPLDSGEKNPFVYDSSDSETEEADDKNNKTRLQPLLENNTEMKAVWKENLFFSKSDHRLIEGLIFFNKINENQMQKERRELKLLMKKRIYNTERKNQMFQKKIGGRKKTIKKGLRRNH